MSNPEHQKRYTAPSFDEKDTAEIKVSDEFVDDTPTIPYDVKRARKIADEVFHIPELSKPAPENDDWRWKGQTPPAGSGVNRNIGAKGLHPDRLRKLQ